MTQTIKRALLLVLPFLLVLGYAATEKTTSSHSKSFENATLTYTGLGIRGSGFFGFQTRRLVVHVQGFTHSALATADGWVIQERDTAGGLTLFGLCVDSVVDDRGAPIPDYNRVQHAAYFYSSDGSTTGTVRDGRGSYDVKSPKGDMHFQIIDRTATYAGRKRI